MSLVGQQLGEFEILDRLGQGGMGAVYKARQVSLGRVVALKTLQASLADDASYIARFRQEAQAAAVLNHPNLVQVYSAGQNEGLHWFAMEYVEGESAKARLQRKGRLDPAEAIAIVICVASALEYGWNKAQLIHRDIKPDNIFLSDRGEVKLGDLGLAKSTGQSQGLTMTGIAIGTPHYMSPEQVEGTKHVGLRSDIYSLGCTLYHLLSGQPPYDGPTPLVVMMKHMSAPVPDLRSVWPECPDDLAPVVWKMMQKDPAGRLQNYQEVTAGLRRAHASLKPGGASAAKGQPVPLRRKGMPMPAVWLVAGAILLAAIVTLACLSPWKGVGGRSGSAQPVQATPPVEATAMKTDDIRGLPSGAATPMAGTASLPVGATPAITASVIAPPRPVQSPSSPAAPAPLPVAAPATPKASPEIEKWFAQVDKTQEETFQKQVLKPFESSTTELQARYLATLDAAIAKASKADRLTDALTFRAERKDFEAGRSFAPDAPGTPADLKTLRNTFRQQAAALEAERITKTKVLLTAFDAALANAQLRLTQGGRIDDALAIKMDRDKVTASWLGPALILSVDAAGRGQSTISSDAQPVSKERPFVNTLGMKFVPVPIAGGATDNQQVLFSVWDTRVQDYESFAHDTRRSWPKTYFPQESTHPAAATSWEDAQQFCQWLTEREHQRGQLPVGFIYRLPSDHEWSCAAGLVNREDPSKSPSDKSEKIEAIYPWGTQWPPPAGAGNYAGEELRTGIAAGKYPRLKSFIAGYNDGFEFTSPVEKFTPNPLGLYDMGGNVWQWCEDWASEDHQDRVQRGAAWNWFNRNHLLSSYRHGDSPGACYASYGFRCVIAAGHVAESKEDSPRRVANELAAHTSAPPVPPIVPSIAPASATKETPFINTLGMRFVPVPITGGPASGQPVLFSVWETRVRDYEAFAADTQRRWPKPLFPQEPAHPAVMVSWEDAQLFCQWLTSHERAAGALPAGWSYRLPGDHEWSCAVELGEKENAAQAPTEKSGRFTDVFPWGAAWPPPPGAGNYAGEELQSLLASRKLSYVTGFLAGYNDGFATTSPVDSFASNRLGLFDMGGNVRQWCEDWYDSLHEARVLRGSGWNLFDRTQLLSSNRSALSPGGRYYSIGFRCVLSAPGP